MKENWFTIFIFSAIFLILGFLLGRTTGHHGHHKGHGGKCCKQSQAHCSGELNEFRHEHDGHRGGHHGHMEQVEVIVNDLPEDFIGDTVIDIPGGSVQINKSADGQIEVKAEMEEMEGHHGEHKIVKEIHIETSEE